MSILSVSHLRVDIAGRGVPIVDDVSLELQAGEILGLVGESGCGKSTVSMALLGYQRRGVEVVGGSVLLDGVDLLSLPEKERRKYRGSTVAYVPQDPATALNPGLRLRRQLVEVLDAHGVGESASERLDLVRRRLTEVKLPTTDEFLARYPHQLSGGQQQRVALAVAFACLPKVLVCDEPTTGLDVSTQGFVLDTIRELSQVHGVAVIYVSHDLAVVSELASSLRVMYAGRLVEAAPVREAFERPRHPYTAALVEAVPRLDAARTLVSISGSAPRPADRGDVCAFADRCQRAEALCTTEAPPARELAPGHTVLCHFPVIDERPAGSGPRVDVVKAPTPSVAALSASDVVVSYGSRQVLHEVGFTLAEGECLAIVGESGSGKTTLTRALVGLVAPGGGDIRLDGDRLAGLAADRTDVQRKKLQIIFQNPYASLNPRRTVGDSVSAPARFLFGESRRDARARAQEALRLVALSPKLVDAYPDQISGGERQRVAIARALICEPEVLVCDEVTSALDVSIQASIVNLLIRLKEERGLGLIFVTHNLPLVASLAERTLVLYQGRVVESDDTSTVLGSPSHPYTKSLLSDTPQPQFT